MWILFAAGSALFAGVTAILAKCGIRKTDSTVATAIRTLVVLVFGEVSIWISRSLAEGKIVFRSPRIGETASPGNDVTADTDQIANSTGSEIVPLPVDIFMVTGFGFLGRCHNLYASVFGWRRPRCLQTSSGAENGRESVFSADRGPGGRLFLSDSAAHSYRLRLRHRSDAHSGRRNCRLPDDSRPVRICKKQPFRTASDRCYDSVMSGSAVNTPPR